MVRKGDGYWTDQRPFCALLSFCNDRRTCDRQTARESKRTCFGSRTSIDWGELEQPRAILGIFCDKFRFSILPRFFSIKMSDGIGNEY